MNIPTEIESRHNWLKKRLGKITASEVYNILSKKKSEDVGKNYLIRKKQEIEFLKSDFFEEESVEDFYSDFLSESMKRGLDFEEEAFLFFQEKNIINDIGFLYYGCNNYAVYEDEENNLLSSPDGIWIEENAIIEIKCPSFENHEKHISMFFEDYETLKKYFLQSFYRYYAQMQMNIFLSDAEKCYFVSYCPEHQIKCVEFEIFKDCDFIDYMKERINYANNFLKKEFNGF